MLRKLSGISVMVCAATLSVTALAGPRASSLPSTVQQVREAVNTHNIAPCRGKKEGDKVTLSTRGGGTAQATCTLTAIRDPAQNSGVTPR